MSLPIIAILRGITPSEAAPIGAALVDAGIDMIEVPLNSPSPLSSICALVDTLPSSTLIGAGTVLSASQVQDVAEVGGRLIVSPNTDPEVIAQAKAREMESWPGAFTPTEAFQAIKAGATGLKLFPGAMAGPSGLKAMKAVLPSEIPVFAVGGAGPENFKEWLKAGADGFGIGTALYQPNDSAEAVAQKAHRIVQAYIEAMDDL